MTIIRPCKDYIIFCQYWHLYIMDYKIMLTNKYLREINAKILSLQKK